MTRARVPVRRSRLVVGVVTTLAALTACSSGTDSDHGPASVRDAILARTAGVDDALVTFHKDPFTHTVDVALSMPGTDPDDDATIGTALDATLAAAWSTTPFEPSSISVRVTTAPLAGEDNPARVSGLVPLRGAAAAGDLPGSSVREELVVLTAALRQHYGPQEQR